MRGIGLAVVLSLGLIFSESVAEAPPAAKVYSVGYLTPGERLSPRGEAFRESLRGRGWVEGQNLVIVYRFGGEQYERLRALAADLVNLKVDVIFAASARLCSTRSMTRYVWAWWRALHALEAT